MRDTIMEVGPKSGLQIKIDHGWVYILLKNYLLHADFTVKIFLQKIYFHAK